MTTLVVTPTFMIPTSTAGSSVSYSLYQGNGVNTATELAGSALPTQLVFDSKVGGPAGAATTGDVVTMSVSPIIIGTASVAKSVVADPSSTPAQASASSAPTSEAQSSRRNVPVLAIILALVAVICISMMFLFLWYRKRARRRGHAHGRVGSEEFGTAPPASDVLRKLGPTYEKSASADPFSDAHAAPPPSDPFADPEKPNYHARTGSDSFLSMGAPRAPYTHAPSASTGSTASGRARKREMEEARKQDMAALNNLVRALDQKERQAQAEGRDRRSLPPVELFKAALIR